MAFESNKIQKIYEGKVGKRYDLSMSHFFAQLIKAFDASSLKANDRVQVFFAMELDWIFDPSWIKLEMVARS